MKRPGLTGRFALVFPLCAALPAKRIPQTFAGGRRGSAKTAARTGLVGLIDVYKRQGEALTSQTRTRTRDESLAKWTKIAAVVFFVVTLAVNLFGVFAK